jgi:hypothetical protein
VPVLGTLRWSDILLTSAVVAIPLPALVAVLLRSRLMGPSHAPGDDAAMPVGAGDRRIPAMRLLALLTIVVAGVQAALGYQTTQWVTRFSASEGPRNVTEVWEEQRAAHLAIAVVPALVLAALVLLALGRRRADRLRALALQGNIMLVVVGFVLANAVGLLFS